MLIAIENSFEQDAKIKDKALSDHIHISQDPILLGDKQKALTNQHVGNNPHPDNCDLTKQGKFPQR
jgi:hypothetical protein